MYSRFSFFLSLLMVCESFLLVSARGKPTHAVTFNKEKLKSQAFLPVINGVDCDRSKDRTYCWVNCEQDQVGYSDHCCRCVCRRGFALGTDRRSCIQASWTPWEPWTPCLSTEWGGLETRSRRCRTKHAADATGRCVGAGSQSRTCSRITKPFVVRKNIRDLSDDEMFDIVQAMAQFKKDQSKNGYNNIIGWHGWPYRCPWYRNIAGHEHGHCSWHDDVRFFAWHRLIVVQAETGINKYLRNKTLGIPFWDWTEGNWEDLQIIIGTPTVSDPETGEVFPNPFYSSVIHGHEPVEELPFPLKNQRSYDLRGVLHTDFLKRGVIRGLLSNTFQFFDKQIEDGPHNQIHMCMCVDYTFNKCTYGMPTTQYAAWDPIFLLHHSQVDRIFALYKLIRDELEIQDWSLYSIAGNGYKNISSEEMAFKMSMPLSPFCNKTMNPNLVTGRSGVWTAIGSYYYEQLFGYRYDNFDVAGKSWRGLLKDMKEKLTRLNWNDEEASFTSTFDDRLGLIDKNTAVSERECEIGVTSSRWKFFL
ncbi:hemocyanin 2-c chain-like isoform X1 [Ciona intestinalis]